VTDTDVEPLDELHTAIQAFSNALATDPDGVGVINHALVVWEETSYHEDGTPSRALYYAATGPAASPASSLGLAEYGRAQLVQHLVRE
jgi:hypothetical protein